MTYTKQTEKVSVVTGRGLQNLDSTPTTRKYETRKKLAGFGIGATLLTVLTGCIGYVEGPSHSRVYASSPPMYVESGVTFQDDYVYYPSYQVYYSSTRRQYIYQQNHAWVTRATPPRVSAEVLIASPSVRLNFHDAPAAHHASIVRQYPKKWAPPASTRGNNEQRGRKKHYSD
jgi:hypothetical protein